MQDHCNGHRCHGDRFSLYEKMLPSAGSALQWCGTPIARRDTVTFLSVHEIQRQHKQQHVYRVKGVAGILERFAVAALPPAIQPDGHQRQ